MYLVNTLKNGFDCFYRDTFFVPVDLEQQSQDISIKLLLFRVERRLKLLPHRVDTLAERRLAIRRDPSPQQATKAHA